MQERVTVTVSTRPELPNSWRLHVEQLLLPLQPIEIEEYLFGYDYYFDHYPQNIELIQAQLKEIGVNSSVWVRYKYSKRELLAAEFLIFSGGRLVNSKARTLTWETRPLCPYCGFEEAIWNLQDLKLKRTPEGLKLAYVDYHPRIVSEVFATALLTASYTGLELVPVGRENPYAWYGLRSNHLLPPVQVPPTRIKHTRGAKPECLLNHALAWRHSPMFFRREDFTAKDFNYTFEYYGSSGSGSRLMVISNRVYRWLLEMRIRNISVEPIHFID